MLHCVTDAVTEVSIRAPAKGAIRTVNWISREVASFNPRPREGSDRQLPDPDPDPDQVSIRAPAKGAIAAAFMKGVWGNRFQSAPPRRERFMPVWVFLCP